MKFHLFKEAGRGRTTIAVNADHIRFIRPTGASEMVITFADRRTVTVAGNYVETLKALNGTRT